MRKKSFEVKLNDDLLYTIASGLLEDMEERLKEGKELVRYEPGNIFINHNNKVGYGQTNSVKDVREAFHQLGLTLFHLATGMEWQPELLPSLNSQYRRLIASLTSNRIVSLSQAKALLKPPNKAVRMLKRTISPFGLILGWLFYGFTQATKGTKNWWNEFGPDVMDFIIELIIPIVTIIAVIGLTIYLCILFNIFLADTTLSLLFIILTVLFPAMLLSLAIEEAGIRRKSIKTFFITALIISAFMVFKVPTYTLANRLNPVVLVNRSNGEFCARFATNNNDKLLVYNGSWINLFTKKYAPGIAAARNGIAVEVPQIGKNKLRLTVGYTLLSDESYLKNLQAFGHQEALEEYITGIVENEAMQVLAECLPVETVWSNLADPAIDSAGSIMTNISEESARYRGYIIDAITSNTQLYLTETGAKIDTVSIAEWPADRSWPKK
ncbi:MAG: hypothetical protein WC473_00190 [Patescibacteria group bacterium]